MIQLKSITEIKEIQEVKETINTKGSIKIKQDKEIHSGRKKKLNRFSKSLKSKDNLNVTVNKKVIKGIQDTQEKKNEMHQDKDWGRIRKSCIKNQITDTLRGITLFSISSLVASQSEIQPKRMISETNKMSITTDRINKPNTIKELLMKQESTTREKILNPI